MVIGEAFVSVFMPWQSRAARWLGVCILPGDEKNSKQKHFVRRRTNRGRVRIWIDERMAIMIPNDVEEFGTDGERIFFNFLRSVAKPDSRYLAWYLPDVTAKGWVPA